MLRQLSCCFNDPMEIDSVPHISVKVIKRRKKTIPRPLKIAVWNSYIGETIGKTKCSICDTNHITQLNFHCGHIVSERDGGATTLINLRPICSSCNLSMGTCNMNDFKNNYFP